jgi:hypothetical protein
MAKTKKVAKKSAALLRPAKKKAAARKPSAKRPVVTAKAAPAAARGGKRQSWLDPKKQTPQIEQHARKLRSFMDAMADGVVERAEVEAQEKRLVSLMREIEPLLDDHLHAKVTELLCELTAYDLMQVLCTMHEARPKSRFRG